MIEKIKEYIGFTDNSSGITFETIILMGLFVVAIGFALFIVPGLLRRLKKIYYNRKDKLEDKNESIQMVEALQMNVAKINTGYVEEDIKDCIEKLIYGIYSSDETVINFDKIAPEIGSPIWETINREHKAGVKRKIDSFEMSDFYIPKQENEYIYKVSKLVCKASFSIKYSMINDEYEVEDNKTFSQTFVISAETWKLISISEEEDVISSIMTDRINNDKKK